jgi:hypothetical protein
MVIKCVECLEILKRAGALPDDNKDALRSDSRRRPLHRSDPKYGYESVSAHHSNTFYLHSQALVFRKTA